jgi:hypothetical protein
VDEYISAVDLSSHSGTLWMPLGEKNGFSLFQFLLAWTRLALLLVLAPFVYV